MVEKSGRGIDVLASIEGVCPAPEDKGAMGQVHPLRRYPDVLVPRHRLREYGHVLVGHGFIHGQVCPILPIGDVEAERCWVLEELVLVVPGTFGGEPGFGQSVECAAASLRFCDCCSAGEDVGFGGWWVGLRAGLCLCLCVEEVQVEG